MALKYPDRLESNNPKAFGIAKAVEISGHKTVKNLDSLYSIADCILSDSKSNLDNDAIGQEWYVIDQGAYYRLVSWENRNNENGWIKRDGSITGDIGDIQDSLNTHISRTDNPHKVTKDQIGLSNVTNDLQVKRDEMGVAYGVATLDDTGKVASSQLPSYVDEILEFQEKDSFPETGESGKIYVELTSNLTYRWSGTQYVEISPSIGLGETSSTAYAGDKGAAVTDRVNKLAQKRISYIDSKNAFTSDESNVGLNYIYFQGNDDWLEDVKECPKMPVASDVSAGILTSYDYNDFKSAIQTANNANHGLGQLTEKVYSIENKITIQ